MWTRAELKENAKQVLRRTYWSGFLVMIIISFLSAGGSGYEAVVKLGQEFNFAVAMPVLGFMGVFSLAYNIFLSNPLMVGKNYYFLRSREHNPELSNIFSRFGNGNYLNVVCTTLIKDIKIFLWTLLLIIPGIIKSYEYYFVSYIIAENPKLSYTRAFEISKDMTDGIKFQIFVLQLSFLGWYLLGAIACGVGVLFVNPYSEATMAELYMAQRAKVLAEYRATEEELYGFRY